MRDAGVRPALGAALGAGLLLFLLGGGGAPAFRPGDTPGPPARASLSPLPPSVVRPRAPLEEEEPELEAEEAEEGEEEVASALQESPETPARREQPGRVVASKGGAPVEGARITVYNAFFSSG